MLTNEIHLHPVWAALSAYFVFTAIVSGMPTPNGSGVWGSPGYKWAFNSLHALAGMLGRIPAIRNIANSIMGGSNGQQ